MGPADMGARSSAVTDRAPTCTVSHNDARRRSLLAVMVATGVTLFALAAGSPQAFGTPGWTPATSIPDPTSSPSDVSIGLTAAGDTIATWQHREGGTDFVVSALKPSGASWGPVTRISEGGQPLWGPHLATNGAGDAIAVWARKHDGTYTIEAAVRPRGGAWGPAQVLDAPGVGPEGLDVAVNAGGAAVVAWTYDDDTVPRAVEAAVWNTRGWEYQGVISGGVTVDPEVSAGIDAGGTPTVAFGRVYSVTRKPDGFWTTPTPVSVPAGESSSPAIAMNEQGYAVAAWAHATGTGDARRYEIQASTRAGGAPWTPPTTLSSPTRCTWDTLDVAINARGDAVAGWASCDDPSSWRTLAAVRLAGGAWESERVLDSGSNGESAPVVNIAADATAVALWTAYAPDGIVRASVHPTGGQWTSPTTLTAAGQNGYRGGLGVGPSGGDVLAAWTTALGPGATGIQIAAYDATPPQIRSLEVPSTAILGQPATFSIGAADLWSALNPTTWRFADSGTATGVSVKHVYTVPGRHSVDVTVSDVLGNMASETRKVQATPPDVTALGLSRRRFRVSGTRATDAARASGKRVKRGTVITYETNARSAVAFTVRRLSRGRRAKPIPGRIQRPAGQGRRHFRFTGWVSGRALSPGLYELRARAGFGRYPGQLLRTNFRVVR